MADDAKESDLARTEVENRFLAECFLAFDQKQGKVNMAAVAQAMGYTNVGSAGNKWAQLKKKFNIDMGTFQGTEGKSKRLGANDPASPKKPTPKRNTRKRKAAPPPKESEHSEEDTEKSPEAGSVTP